MTNVPPSPPRTTTTLFSYLDRLLGEKAPRSASLLLGLRWCFGWPKDDLATLAEWSFPVNPTPLTAALSARGGVVIAEHDGDRAPELRDHLANGRAAVAAIDAYYLPFRPAFRRIHSARTALVRPGPTPDTVHVFDGWRPAADGILPMSTLEAARFSQVPLNREREALFAGQPIGGRWWSLEYQPLAIPDLGAWMAELLGELWRELTEDREDERARYGLRAMSAFVTHLESTLGGAQPAAAGIEERRRLSLLLRSELSSRLFLGVFLRNAAHLLGGEREQAAVASYRARLGHLQAALDGLTKTVRTYRPEYDRFVFRELALALANEHELADVLAPLVASNQRPVSRGSTAVPSSSPG